MRIDGEFLREWGPERFLCSIIGGAPGGMGGPGKGNPNSTDKQGGTGQGGMGGSNYNKPAGPGASIAASKKPGGMTGNKPTGQTGSGGGSYTYSGGYSDTRDDPASIENRARNQDAQNVGESWGDGLSGVFNEFMHGLGSMVGLSENEESLSQTANDMARPGYQGPAGGPGTGGTESARWGWDPVGMVGGALGNAFGVPIVGGLIADQISDYYGRPLQVDLGPHVLQADDGQTTVSGPSATFSDRDNPGTFYGSTPGLNSFSNGAAAVAPKKSTFYGSDGGAAEPAPSPEQPPMEVPGGLSPTEIPDGVNVDTGNSGLSPSQLSSIFQQYGSKVYRGKNKSTVVS